MALGVSRSKVLSKKTRSTDWADLRKSLPKADDADLKDAIAYVAKDRATYGYRRVWARLKSMAARLTTSACIGSFVMKFGFCSGKVRSLWTPESTKAQWQSKKAKPAGVQMDWSCRATTGKASEWHSRWTDANEKS